MENIYTASRAQGISGEFLQEAAAERKGPAWPGAVLAAVLAALLLTACSAGPTVSDDKVDQTSFSLGSG